MCGKRSANRRPRRSPRFAAAEGVELPEREGHELHALVTTDLVRAFLVQQDELRG